LSRLTFSSCCSHSPFIPAILPGCFLNTPITFKPKGCAYTMAVRLQFSTPTHVKGLLP
jgi:hypothetical protein